MGAEALKWWEPTHEAHPPVDSVKRRVGIEVSTRGLVERLVVAGLEVDDALSLLAHPQNVDALTNLVLNEFRRGVQLSDASLQIVQSRSSAERPTRSKSGKFYACRVKDPVKMEGIEYQWHDRLYYIVKHGVIQQARPLPEAAFEPLFEEEGVLNRWRTQSSRSIIESLPVTIHQDTAKVEVARLHGASSLVPRTHHSLCAYRQPPHIPRWLTKRGSELTVIVMDLPSEGDRLLLEEWAKRYVAEHAVKKEERCFFADPAIRIKQESPMLIPSGFNYELLPGVPHINWDDPANATTVPPEFRRFWDEGFSLIKNVPANGRPLMLWSQSSLITFLQALQGYGGWSKIVDLTVTGRIVRLQCADPRSPLMQLSWI